jgi:hypothetical protein
MYYQPSFTFENDKLWVMTFWNGMTSGRTDTRMENLIYSPAKSVGYLLRQWHDIILT